MKIFFFPKINIYRIHDEKYEFPPILAIYKKEHYFGKPTGRRWMIIFAAGFKDNINHTNVIV